MKPIYLTLFLIAFTISYVLTPLIRLLSIKMGWFDKPNYRKINSEPMPLLGGMAIFISYTITLFILHLFHPHLFSQQKFMGFWGSTMIIIVAGVVDDIFYITPRRKLFYQVCAASLAYVHGFNIAVISGPTGGHFAVPMFVSYLLTVFWMVGFTNAVNLLDGLDGLAAGVSAIVAMTLFFAGVRGHNTSIAILSLPLAASALGFLRYNFYPAKIFMGDTGSMFLGFSLALISIEGAFKGSTFFAIFVPIIAMGLPFFDTGLSIIRRIIMGQKIFQADKEHVHHQLLMIKGHQKNVVLTLYMLTISFGLIAVSLAGMHGMGAFVAVVITTILTIQWAKSFGLLDFFKNKPPK